MISDYAGLTSKISLLTGAGMTIYGAITSITSAYKKQKEKKGGQKKEAYEHLSETLDMIKMGEGEAESYVRFGELCTVREYKKLGVYLSENFKKGTGDIGRLLGEEARESFIKQKANVKVKAEEATTRLLFPMTLMLGVVMAVVLVPSMLSFTI